MTALLIFFLVSGQINPDTIPPVDSTMRWIKEKSPGRAVLLSFFIPGGGQIYTGNYLKAVVIAPAEVTLGYLSYSEHIKARDALVRGDSSAYLFYRDRRNNFLFWTGAVLVFSMADAYVSAELFGFEQQMRLAVGPDRIGIQLSVR